MSETDPRNGRRRLALFALVVGGILLCILLLWLRAVVKAPKAGPPHPHIPTVAKKQDTGHVHAPIHAAENDFATVQCTVAASNGVSIAAGEIRATAVEADDVDPGTVKRSVPNGDELTLTVPPGRWALAWGFGHLPSAIPLGTVDLVEGDVFRCAVSPLGVPVSGVVVDKSGQPVAGVHVEGCGRSPVTDADGKFSFVAPFGVLRGAEHACPLRARWEDGMLSRYSDPSMVTALTPGPFTITLDTSPVAGMGITLDGRPDGIYVRVVHAGTPAEDADLRAGDKIVAIDGHDTDGMSAMDFIPYGVGADGSTVTLDLERDGETLRKSFRRERIIRVDTGGGAP